MGFECLWFFFFLSIRRHTIGALVTGVQTCALPIYPRETTERVRHDAARGFSPGMALLVKRERHGERATAVWGSYDGRHAGRERSGVGDPRGRGPARAARALPPAGHRPPLPRRAAASSRRAPAARARSPRRPAGAARAAVAGGLGHDCRAPGPPQIGRAHV